MMNLPPGYTPRTESSTNRVLGRTETLAPKPRFRWPNLRYNHSLFRRLPPFTSSPSIRPLFRRETRPSKLSILLRVLVGPLRTRRTQNRLWDLRHEALPALRHRAQSRIYRAIVNRQARLAARNRRSGGGFVAYLLGPRRRLRGGKSGLGTWASRLARRSRAIKASAEGPSDAARGSMAQSSLSSTWGVGSGDGTAPGSRRKKAYEWLKAANELGQAYTSRWTGPRNDSSEDYYHTPGAFPDVEIARSGDEEMVLFPSYGRRFPPKKANDTKMRPRRDSWSETIDEYRGVSEESDRSGNVWPEMEIENAVVDVDVRGWIYAPNRGPMSRKHRLMVKLARTLSGIPTPSGTANEDGPDAPPSKGEDEYVDKQMQTLVDTAERDADQAWKSSHTERAREGVNQVAQWSKDEISMANAHLMERLRPFLTNPVSGMPVTIFFFNNDQSESRNLMTDESGHFSVRAPLPFVPTHVRVLASEDLSAAKPIEIIGPTGISLISDIDDTVKHSAIASGAKEMFRNTFVRELAELKVAGVSEWYTQVAKKGVEMHYVSNAPWQLYPLLERYFKMVDLPPGSFHLKQYSGMLQGIFEPTAERKRGSLEQIMRDFPERKFILVGDSGEADLEVYTDIVLANPGRILGIFIRDVTTPEQKPFFDQSVKDLDAAPTRSRSTPQLVDNSDSAARRPTLPPRRPMEKSGSLETDTSSLDNGDLIDLRNEEEPRALRADASAPAKPRLPPTKPLKPSSLRTASGPRNALEPPASMSITPSQEAIRRKPVPPLPPRRTSTPKTDSLIDLDPSPISRSQTEPVMEGDRAPAIPTRNKPPPPVPPPRRINTASSTSSSATTGTAASRPAPPPKPSYPTAAAQAALQYATERLNLSSSPVPVPGLRPTASNQSLGRTNSGNSYNTAESEMPPAPLPNKREELWRRRWERASEILETHGVVLGSWRVGSDAQSVCMWLIEEQLKKLQDSRDQ
ncbi:hypothetical protein N7532_004936 [Penicillium argentinense]|uniref:Phosphatidate phosphatase APP1 catalytic domain-containing protein n=1 Tax=Penicillium argentinense TaxID=1131581 RepID=A0A9W9K9H8_9EURO|nr:uncharacterized protein N7532_004936 [Penicillium argentinense]KAJ5097935.1 hypothetical protein N7532_004936 [Penicillium argentinense]